MTISDLRFSIVTEEQRSLFVGVEDRLRSIVD